MSRVRKQETEKCSYTVTSVSASNVYAEIIQRKRMTCLAVGMYHDAYPCSSWLEWLNKVSICCSEPSLFSATNVEDDRFWRCFAFCIELLVILNSEIFETILSGSLLSSCSQRQAVNHCSFRHVNVYDRAVGGKVPNIFIFPLLSLLSHLQRERGNK